MRVRTLITCALLLPGAVSAQRRIGGRIGGRVAPPVDLPPQAPAIANEMRYVRLPISGESYTFISFVESPTAGSNALASWGTLNAATRLSYRLNPFFLATADMTQSVLGGPVRSGTLELGTRFQPNGGDSESRTRPFIDARAGYMYSYESYLYSPNPTVVNPSAFRASRFGNGFGVIGGVGSEYSLTRTVSLTTGMWATRSRLRAARTSGFQPTPVVRETWRVTTYRLSLGLKWNPVRAVPPTEP
ncbi:MAG: hypothetical protein AABZ80_12890 [Gemmatimonadota bacterium]